MGNRGICLLDLLLLHPIQAIKLELIDFEVGIMMVVIPQHSDNVDRYARYLLIARPGEPGQRFCSQTEHPHPGVII